MNDSSVILGPLTAHLALSELSTDTTARLADRFGAFLFEGVADVDVSLVGRGRHPFTYLDEPLTSAGGEWILGCSAQLQRTADGRWQGEVVDSPMGVEGALRWIVAMECFPRPGLLVHGASAVVDGRGHLVVGPSGAGKTTLALSSDVDSVLTDELSVLTIEDGRPVLWPNPFWGMGHVGRLAQSVPLDAIWFLSGWQRTGAHLVDDACSISRFYSSVLDIIVASSAEHVLQLIVEIVGSVPCSELQWRKGDPLAHRLAQWTRPHTHFPESAHGAR